MTARFARFVCDHVACKYEGCQWLGALLDLYAHLSASKRVYPSLGRSCRRPFLFTPMMEIGKDLEEQFQPVHQTF